ncbi:MAG: hypothetical protein CFE41_16515 [Burkholderiales bacterium PBB2]|nr:MAG: hypothetical protein CFE41_16515 [Burkholderiales bacterium PBB2]
MNRIGPSAKVLGACLSILMAFCLNPAQAQNSSADAAPAQTQASNSSAAATMRVCQADIKKHCAANKPGGGRVIECLKKNEAELASTCRSQLDAVAECGQQMKKVCGSAVVEHSAQQACLKSHAAEFSATCRSALSGQ